MASKMSATLVRAWYEGAWWLYLFLPFSLLYWLVISFRRLLYAMGVFSTYGAGVPIIVVGNISLGGTGKSPLVAYLVKSLQDKGFKPGIVSRGYGATISSNDCREVQVDSLSSEVGDEPLMLKKRLGCPIFVSPNRQLSIAHLEKTGCDIIIADDGMQHYAMERDLEICVFDGERKLGNGWVLPMGPLRESARRVKTVDSCVVNGTKWRPESNNVVHMKLVPGNFTPLVEGEQSVFDPEAMYFAAAAIGNPDRFFKTLRKMGIKLETQAFDDHHAFVKEDFNSAGDKAIVMTEKDAVKCASLGLKNAWYLPVDAELDSSLVDEVVAKLKQKGYFNG